MASTAEETATPSITIATALSCASKLQEAAAARRRAYELGFRQSDERVATARSQAQRWKDEATWWREEHDRVHQEFCDFVLYVASELGLKP